MFNSPDFSKERIDDFNLLWEYISTFKKKNASFDSYCHFLGHSITPLEIRLIKQSLSKEVSMKYEDFMHAAPTLFSNLNLKQALLIALNNLSIKNKSNIPVEILRERLTLLGKPLNLSISEINIFLNLFESLNGTVMSDVLIEKFDKSNRLSIFQANVHVVL